MTFRNPVLTGERDEDHGDPFIVRYLDSYFLYHTGDTSGRRGVSVHRSTNLVDWEFQGYALEAAPSGWAWSDLWAPEVVYERGTFYMYISATRQREAAAEGDDARRRLGVARAQHPLGPFQWDEHPLVDSWAIDGHPFRDDDGTLWLFYNVRNQHTSYADGTPGTGIVCDRLVAPDRLAHRPRVVVSPSQRWEGTLEGDFYWNEAPYVLKRRRMYHLMYSGGHFTDETYAIGLARSYAPTGPWEKALDNPTVRGTDAIRGPGHHSFVFGPDAATRYAVYHGYIPGDAGRKVHLDRLRWRGDRPVIVGPTAVEQPCPPQPVYDEAVPHWVAETWARGRWVELGGRRFPLHPHDVWHQIEAEQVDGRLSVRNGGVHVASYPAVPDAAPRFAGDAEFGPTTVTSCAVDAHVHELPAYSTYEWRWRGSTALELALAVRGEVTVAVGDDVRTFATDDGDFHLVELTHAGPAATIAVEAGDGGATVTDLAVYARS